jgi:hypothetical protein
MGGLQDYNYNFFCNPAFRALFLPSMCLYITVVELQGLPDNSHNLQVTTGSGCYITSDDNLQDMPLIIELP